MPAKLKPSEALHSWTILNDALRDCDEAFARAVLQAARRRKGISSTYLNRIHSRINRLRAERERSELVQRLHPKPRRR